MDIYYVFEKINIVAVLDHSGRAGNLFCTALFDRHSEVLCCPLIQYSYSYALTYLKNDKISYQDAHDYLYKYSYFRLLLSPSEKNNQELIYKMGLDGQADVDVEQLKIQIDKFLNSKQNFSRKEIVCIPILIYAKAQGRNLSSIKYIMVSDALSLRHESVINGYSGDVIDSIVNDFPKAKLIHLVRDPRATFASPKHQFINMLGNMYTISPVNYFKRFYELLFCKLTMTSGCVYLFWLLYLAQTAKTINNKKLQYPKLFYTLKNENINCNFIPTMQNLCTWLNINIDKVWLNKPYEPTICNKIWQGAGAYNSRYQSITNGMLQNDSKHISKSITGPNEYVTKRWRTKLNSNEVILIEFLFAKEISEHNYPVLYPAKNTLTFIKNIAMPFNGELPSFKWLLNKNIGSTEHLKRLFYAIFFIPFYVVSRIVTLKIILKNKIFDSSFARNI
jgi:hypothetical protein